MKAEEIINQLRRTLPFITDSFTDNISISSLNRSGSTVTAVSTSPHGLDTGDYAFIKGAYNPINITSAVRTGTSVLCTTSDTHDLTEGFNCEVLISGFNEAEYNGTFDLVSVTDRNTFTYEVQSGLSNQPTGTGVLNEDLAISFLNNLDFGYNGYRQITKVDDTTFTYNIANTPNSPATGTITASINPRISGAISFEVAKASYEKQTTGKLWAFVIIEDGAAGRDRRQDSDTTYTDERGNYYLQDYIQPFSVYVFSPCKNEYSARATRDLMSDVRINLYKSLLTYKPDTGFSDEKKYGITAVSDNFSEYNNSYYIHRFQFEIMSSILVEDVFKEYSVALQSITVKTKNENGVDIKTDVKDF
jgi:hypothetical protein